jgi:hypothetical protein
MRAPLALLLLAACDDASFIVRVHRDTTGDIVSVVSCPGCAAVNPFEAAPDAFDRNVGFFVHTVPETLNLQWKAGHRCDQFGVHYAGTPFTFDLWLGTSAPEISGCPSCSVSTPCDAAGGGGAGGGSAAGGGTGTGGGTSAGGGTSMGGGATGPLQWHSMQLPPATHLVSAVQAYAPDDVWAAAGESIGSAVFYLADAGTWIAAVETSGSDGLTDLAVTQSPPLIAAVELFQAWECDRGASGCRAASDWQTVPVDSPGMNNLNKLCTDGTHLYATGTSSAVGALFIRGSGSYHVLATAPGLGQLQGCTVLPDGSIAAGASGHLAWYRADAGMTVVDVVAPGFNGTLEQWVAAQTAGGRTFFAGDGHAIVEWLGDGGFALGFNPGPPSATLRALAGIAPEDLIAAGDDSASNSTVTFDGTTWSGGDSLYPLLNVYGMTAVDDRTYYAGGQLRSSSGGIIGGMILRGTR